jgi:hypothetical protein
MRRRDLLTIGAALLVLDRTALAHMTEASSFFILWFNSRRSNDPSEFGNRTMCFVISCSNEDVNSQTALFDGSIRPNDREICGRVFPCQGPGRRYQAELSEQDHTAIPSARGISFGGDAKRPRCILVIMTV